MSRNELISFIKIGILAGEASAIAGQTEDKAWHKKLATMATYAEQITEERLACLDPLQINSVARRNKHSKIVLHTEDSDRYAEDDTEIAKIAVDDLQTLAELGLTACLSCQQGQVVKDCKFRLVMHKLDIEVANDDPGPGECEYRLPDSEIQLGA